MAAEVSKRGEVICANAKCGIEFKPVRKKQRFHCKACKDAEYNFRRPVKRSKAKQKSVTTLPSKHKPAIDPFYVWAAEWLRIQAAVTNGDMR